MPRSTYYYYVKKSKEPDKYANIKNEIHAIYHENRGRYGYRRITLELQNRGYCINHKTVQRLMRELGIKTFLPLRLTRSGQLTLLKFLYSEPRYISHRF